MRKLAVLTPLALLGGLFAMGTAQAAPPADGDRIALIVGVDHHQGATRSNMGAVGDAEDVRDLLVRRGWRSENVRMLTDGAATAGAIRDGLSWLASQSNDNSFAVFHYSGHVKQTGSTEYLWPHDNQFISDTDVVNTLRGVKGYLWADFSGCEAAGFDEGLSGPKSLVTAASQSWEKGYELPAELRNSVFTNLLVDKALMKKQGDANGDGKVSIQEAFRHAEALAPLITSDQSFGPQHPYMAGGDGDDWFVDRAATPYSGRAAKRSCFLIFC
ncbi:MAG: caspase family protein [Actinomycetota bacterium]|nr:caspase family protein [Actinomycetota bacterium]